jgi:hypothetical protein
MLSDEQLIDRLQSELAPLQPRADLAEQLRGRAQMPTRLLSRLRPHPSGSRFRLRLGMLALVASGLTIVAVGAAVLVLANHEHRPVPHTLPSRGTRATLPHTSRAAVGQARPNAGPVTCQGRVCRQGQHRVRNPSGSSCGQHSSWVANTNAPQITYGCANRSVAGY